MARKKGKKKVTYTQRTISSRMGYTRRKVRFQGVYPFTQLCNNPNATTALSTYNGLTAYMEQVTGATTFYTNSFMFKLNDIPQYTTFTALFDTYRITKVDIRITPMITQAVLASVTYSNVSPSVGGTYPFGYCYWLVDNDDASNLSTRDAFIEYQKCKSQPTVYGKNITLSITPRIATPAYASGAFTAYAEGKKKTWVDCAYPAIEHYGIKFGIDGTAGPQGQIYRIQTRYHLEFKNVR